MPWGKISQGGKIDGFVEWATSIINIVVRERISDKGTINTRTLGKGTEDTWLELIEESGE